MQDNITAIRDKIARIRRNPEVAPTMITLALSDIADAIEDLNERLKRIESAQQPATTKRTLFGPNVGNEWAVGAKF